MPAWLRNAVTIIFLLAWCLVIAAYLFKNQIPPTPLISIPPALLLSTSSTTVVRKVIKNLAKTADKLSGEDDEEEAK